MSKKLPVSEVVTNFQNFLANLDEVTTPKDIEESEESYLNTKRKQVSMLFSKYLQSRLLRSLEVEDVKHQLIDLVMVGLQDASPSTVLKTLSELSEIGQNDMALLLGGSSPNAKGGQHQPASPVNLFINQQSQPTAINQASPANNDSKLLKSMAKIYQCIVSDAKAVNPVLDVESEKVDD